LPLFYDVDWLRDWLRSVDSTFVEWIRERSLLLDDLEEYTNSNKPSRICFATVKSTKRDHWVHPEAQPLTEHSVNSCI